MATYSKRNLSASTNGKNIKIAATATPGTLLHTAVSGILDQDEVWLYAANLHTANLELTLELGGVAAPDDQVKFSVPFKSGLYLVVPGFVFNNGLAIRAFAASANLIVVTGWVNRITA
jgi:hypothetical protein